MANATNVRLNNRVFFFASLAALRETKKNAELFVQRFENNSG
jgi:hypothetical protein